MVCVYCACNLAYVTCFNSISRQRGDPDVSLLSLEPGLFSLTDIGAVTRISPKNTLTPAKEVVLPWQIVDNGTR